jgi:transcriptional regulator
MTAGRLEAMKKAIVGMVMTVDEIEGSFKLNQHKSDADYTALTEALATQPDADARVIAGLMREQRPLAFPAIAPQADATISSERNAT